MYRVLNKQKCWKLIFTYTRFSQSPLYAISILLMVNESVENAAFIAIRTSISMAVYAICTWGIVQYYLKLRADGKNKELASNNWTFLSLLISILAVCILMAFSIIFEISNSIIIYSFFYVLINLFIERNRAKGLWKNSSVVTISIDAHIVFIYSIHLYYTKLEFVSIGDLSFYISLFILCPLILIAMTLEYYRSYKISIYVDLFKNKKILIYFWFASITTLLLGEFVTLGAANFGDKEIILVSLALKAASIIILPLTIAMVISGPKLAGMLYENNSKIKREIGRVGLITNKLSLLIFTVMLAFNLYYSFNYDFNYLIIIPIMVAAYINSATGLCSLLLNITGKEKNVFIFQLQGGLISFFFVMLGVYFTTVFLLTLGVAIGIIYTNIRMFTFALLLGTNTSGLRYFNE